MEKIILDLCGGTGEWSKYYAANGYRVLNITLPSRDLLDEKTIDFCIAQNPYGILFAVDCTIWANSGAQYFKNRSAEEVFYYSKLLVKGLRIILSTKPKFWCIENPVGKMKQFLGEPKLIFNPCDYGDPYTKKTLLWGEFNIPVKNPVEPIKVCSQGSWIQRLGGKSEKTKRLRSITPSGFAKSFFEANR
jgi:hypothetical protein